LSNSEEVVFVAACIVSNHLPCICEHKNAKMPLDSTKANTEQTNGILGIVLSVFGTFRM